jgi:hypothetical protein
LTTLTRKMRKKKTTWTMMKMRLRIENGGHNGTNQAIA